MRMENWSIHVGGEDPYKAPEEAERRLHGNVYGNPKFPDGHEVTTSSIKKVDYPNKRVETQNSVYELGKVSPEYAAWIRKNRFKLKHLKLEEFE